MWVPFKKLICQRQQRRDLNAFREEIAKNLEIFYVMRQLGALRSFQTAEGERTFPKFTNEWPKAIPEYTRRVLDYNFALKKHEDYQAWYTHDINRQNQANAKILHDLQEVAQERSEGIELFFKNAQAAIDDL